MSVINITFSCDEGRGEERRERGGRGFRVGVVQKTTNFFLDTHSNVE